jgi:carbon monoxide dehydrogenase subunit G
MDMSGEKLIAAPREAVWEALNDPEILRACIPGCETIEKVSDTEMKAAALVTLGPISSQLAGKFLLSDLDPPNGYTISGEGQGAGAGIAKGRAKVSLEDAEGGTKLGYSVKAQVGGKLAQLGGGVIDTAAKDYADRFFTRFAELVTPPPVQALPPAVVTETVLHIAHEDHDHDPSNPHYFGLPIGVILAAGIAAISVGITLFKFFVLK